MKLALSLLVLLALGCTEVPHTSSAKHLTDKSKPKTQLKDSDSIHLLYDTIVHDTRFVVQFTGSGDTGYSRLIFTLDQCSDTEVSRFNGWNLFNASDGFANISATEDIQFHNLVEWNANEYLFALPSNNTGRKIVQINIREGCPKISITPIFSEGGIYFDSSKQMLLVPIVRGRYNGTWECWCSKEGGVKKIGSYNSGKEHQFPISKASVQVAISKLPNSQCR